MLNHSFPFDPTYGYTQEQMLRLEAPRAPGDFEAFWRDTYAQARAVPTNITQRQVACPDPAYDKFEIEFDAWGGVRIGGWLMVPKDRGSFRRGMVIGHGYGGRDNADAGWIVGPPAAAIFPCARGFHRSARADLPNVASQHVIHGIDSRETYLHRGCVTDLWAAATALLELFPQVEDNLDYAGASFGGGIGALALPWEPRFRRAFLEVPSFGNHPIRLQLPCVGSGESVRNYVQDHPQVREILRYYDAATASTFTRIPTLVGAALFDPAVPPPGQFTVYNALAGEKKLLVEEAAHFEWPGMVLQQRRMLGVMAEWFS